MFYDYLANSICIVRIILKNFRIGLKFILFKKVLAKHNSLVNLHDSAPIFQANMHQNAGQNHANLLGYWVLQVCSQIKWTVFINHNRLILHELLF